MITNRTQITDHMWEEILDLHDDYYADEPRIDWHTYLERLERRLNIDLGSDMDSDAIKAIRTRIRKYRNTGN